MAFRLCWLLLAIFLASCSGSEESAGTFDTPDPVTSVQAGSAVFTYGPNDWVDRLAVSEVPSSKAQTISLKGATIPFTATAGHLIASMEAAIFYTAYTRDDQPHESRPVTFVFNGGPGGASAALDLEFLGPKSVDPSSTGTDLRFTDNPNTLLDRTDLVFVDPVGTGYSTAVKPNRNRNYWGVDSDAEILADFITRYINVNNRQSSPKYIYGVSYGGIRAPIIGRLLLENDTSKYAIDPSHQPAKILSGLILNSPLLDYKTDCYLVFFETGCGGAIPTYAMVSRFHKKESQPIDPFLADARTFAGQFNVLHETVFKGVDQETPDRTKWDAFLKKPEGPIFLDQLFQLTGIGRTYQPGDNRNNNTWIDNPNMNPVAFTEKYSPGKKLVLGDGRFFLTTTIDPAFDRKDIYYDFIGRYQNELMGYSPTSPYIAMNGAIIDNWDDEPDPALSPNGDRWLSSIPDMAFSMTLNPNLKVLVQHGYYDLNTPFYQSQLNVTSAGLSARIPVKLYEGGHGVSPFDTGSYDRLIQELNAFYDQPHGQTLAAMNAPVTEKETP